MREAKAHSRIAHAALAACAACAALSVPDPLAVRAQETPPAVDAARAREHFAAGQAHVEAREWDSAYREFELGYALSGRPPFLFNMAECAREAGRTSRARADYARYLAVSPEGPSADTARERLAILGPEPAPEAVAERLAPASSDVASASATDLPPPALAIDTTHPAPRDRDVWEDWPFWTVIGVVVVAAGVGATVGIALTTDSAPSCGAGCDVLDWRTR
jgi:hypothetical protein